MQPTAVIFSRENFLCKFISDQLTANDCRVIVIDGQNKNYKGEIDYFIFVGKTKEELEKAQKFLDGKPAKSLFVFPLSQKGILAGPRSVYLGEVYGPGMDVREEGILRYFLRRVFDEGAVEIPDRDAEIAEIFAGDAATEIIRFLFSYGFSGKETILAQKTTIYKFLRELQQSFPGVSFVQGAKAPDTAKLPDEVFVLPKTPTKDSWRTTFDWLKGHPPVVEKAPPPRKRKGNAWLLAGLGVILFLISPLVFLCISLAGLKFSFDSFVSGNQQAGEVLISASDVFSSAGLQISQTLAGIPGVGRAYASVSDWANLVKEASVIGKRTDEVVRLGKELSAGVLGDADYDLAEVGRRLAVNFELLYQDSSFLQGEIDKVPGLSQKISAAGIDLFAVRQVFLHGQSLAKRLPVILGGDKPTTYLITFQNNMELRPTGGFIGSFALVTFSKGKLANTEFFDVYTADGQLKGHVEPPAPIKNYLGEANWFLRDSNWDPDFAISGERAEWFLDKELDRSVDGVIGVDLEVPESLLKSLGPVRLNDFNADIDYKNLYEKVQYQAEAGFFPGSQQKKNILTALGQALLDKIKNTADVNYEQLARSIYANLESRHVQVFMHDDEVARAISSLGWSGEVVGPSCVVPNCAAVLAGVVEANVGVDKVNYFISRSLQFNSFVNSAKIENTLTVTIKNNAPAALGVSGRYKNYLRLIADAPAKIKQVGIIGADGTKVVAPDIATVSGRLEVGTLVDIGPGSQKAIRFTWEEPVRLNFAVSGQIVYLLRKQAGTGDDPLAIKIVPPAGVDFLGKSSYNTTLGKDSISQVSW